MITLRCFVLSWVTLLVHNVQGYLMVVPTSTITRTNSSNRGASDRTHGKHTTTAKHMSNSPLKDENKNYNASNLSPKELIVKGMKAFQQGKIQESIQYFDQADALVPNDKLSPFLWQRGISLYYADLFQEASHQFQLDVRVNPLDVEEIVWDIASQNRLNNNNHDNMKNDVHYMSLPPGKSDRRRIMSIIYSLFRHENNVQEQDLMYAGQNGSISDEFYSLFYLGLYCESIGETSKASYYMRAATQTEYARGKGASDYMTSCARVHCQLRHWI